MSYKQYIPDVKDHWDSYWKKTSIEKELKLTDTDGLLPLFEKYLPKEGKILEAGCGLGKWIIVLTKKGYDIQGIDNNEYAVEKLKEYLPEAKVKEDDVENLSFSNKQFDAYLSLGVVEHFEHGPHKALKEAFRVLKPGGIAFIEVPYDSPLRKVTRILIKIYQLLKLPLKIIFEKLNIKEKSKLTPMKFYEYRYTRKELAQFLEKAGFHGIKIYPKDDLAQNRSISLWLDYQWTQNNNARLFELNKRGKLLKAILEKLSPFLYSALIVAIAKKP